MNVTVAVLEKDKKELEAKLLQADKDRTAAKQGEADLAKKVRVIDLVVLVNLRLLYQWKQE